MTLIRSKTWPTSALAVVHLRIDQNGRKYSTLTKQNLRDLTQNLFTHLEGTGICCVNGNTLDSYVAKKGKESGAVNGPSSRKPDIDLLRKMPRLPPKRITIRTDTVSTILDTEFDAECQDDQGENSTKPEENATAAPAEDEDEQEELEKFHVLALTRIEEGSVESNESSSCLPHHHHNHHHHPLHAIGRRPSIRVDNWDFIYTETCTTRASECPVHRYLGTGSNNLLARSGVTNGGGGTPKDSPLDLPLDARKTTTLRRHYYPEGGWGWVVVVCAVLVHVLNHGVQLSYSQLILPGAEKFKTDRIHFAVQNFDANEMAMKNKIRVTVVGDGDTGKTCMLIVYKDRKFDERYIPTVFDVYSMTIPINQKEYTVILSDTAGQEEFDKLRQLAYKDTDVFVLCYSVNQRSSFENVKEKWAPELRRFCPRAKLILAATKCDLKSENTITEREGAKLARSIKADGFIENSAKYGTNINETICLALTAVVNAGKRDSGLCSLL